ncbi:MAG: Ser-Thr-rich GPI-anchored membrane family protein [Promethearchaeota archaeon]
MKKITVAILICVLFIAGFTFLAPPARAILRDQTISTIAEKDTYVNSYENSTNYGSVDYALAGAFLHVYDAEAYFYFSFSDKPTNFTKAEISLYCGFITLIKNVTICLIEEQWGEFSMTWLNKPTKGIEISTLLINRTDIYKIDVSNFITGRNNISICAYIKNEDYVDDNSPILTREGYFSPESAPQIIWTYPENAEITVTYPSSSSIWVDSAFYGIRWTSIGTVEDVKIQLYKGTTLIENITYTSAVNDGEYDFYVSPTGNYRGTDYRIKISDYNDPNLYGYSDYFSINVGSGTITINRPTSSDSWQQGTSHSISWSITGIIINVDIEIYKGDALKYSDYNVSNTGFWHWAIDENIEIGTDWRVKIINSDNSSQYDWSDYFKIISALGPPIPGYNYYVVYSLLIILTVIVIRRIKK